MRKKLYMAFENILLTFSEDIATLTINRPDKLNALNQATLKEISEALDAIEQTQRLKGVIVTGSGDKAFVAGADISEFQGLSVGAAEELARNGQQLFFRIERLSVPVIACVNGFALGGGCELAMACHIRIGNEKAKFGQPEVNLGIIPGYGGTQRLIQYIGKGKALELLMTADMIDATTALNLGLLNHVVAQEELLEKAATIIAKIGTKGPLAIAAVIRCANAFFDETKDGFSEEAKAFGGLFTSTDVIEGTSAFLEKRKANFKGV